MAPSPAALPDALREFVDSAQWTFAKTMPEWPHEYIVRERVDEELFVKLVGHIRANGYEGKFYRRSFTYYDDGGLVYWTMGAPVEETIIINRCRREDTYEKRLQNGTLPATKNVEAEDAGAGDVQGELDLTGGQQHGEGQTHCRGEHEEGPRVETLVIDKRPTRSMKKAAANDFRPLRAKLDELENACNPGRENVHFTSLERVDPALFTSLLGLAREGRGLVRQHREFFVYTARPLRRQDVLVRPLPLGGQRVRVQSTGKRVSGQDSARNHHGTGGDIGGYQRVHHDLRPL